MREYVILTDSSCDLPASFAAELEVEAVPLMVLLEGKEYHNYLDEREISFHDFYAAIRAGKKSTSSAVNVDQFTKAMEVYLQAGKDILYLGFSSGLSVTYHSATLAAEDLREKYPEAKIVTIDTLCASMGQGLVVYLAVQEKRKGKGLDEVATYIQEMIPHITHYFTVDDLHHLKRGGRISAATALLGSTFQIKPILHVDDTGHLVNVDKVRGRKQSIKKLAEMFDKMALDKENQMVFIFHGDCEAEAEQLASYVRELTPVKGICISHIGPVIGTHSGPGTLTIGFVGKNR